MDTLNRTEAEEHAFNELSNRRRWSIESRERLLNRRLKTTEFEQFQVTGGNASSLDVTIAGPLVAEMLARRTDGYVDPATGGWIPRAPIPTMIGTRCDDAKPV